MQRFGEDVGENDGTIRPMNWQVKEQLHSAAGMSERTPTDTQNGESHSLLFHMGIDPIGSFSNGDAGLPMSSGPSTSGMSIGTRRGYRYNTLAGSGPPPAPGPPPSVPPPPPPKSAPADDAPAQPLHAIPPRPPIPTSLPPPVPVKSPHSTVVSEPSSNSISPIRSMGHRPPQIGIGIPRARNDASNFPSYATTADGVVALAPSSSSRQAISPRKSSLSANLSMGGSIGGPSLASTSTAAHERTMHPANGYSISTTSEYSHGPSSKASRTPSRVLLQSALELAQQAVEFDRLNDVPRALAMYRDAVGRLRRVMHRVGIDLGPLPQGLGLPEPTETELMEFEASARRRRVSGSTKSEEEGRTLKGIHDAYIARIGLLVVMQTSDDTESPVNSDYMMRSESLYSKSRTASIASEEHKYSASSTSRLSGSSAGFAGEMSPSVTAASLNDGSAATGVFTSQVRSSAASTSSMKSGKSRAPATDLVDLYPPPLSAAPRPRPRVQSLSHLQEQSSDTQSSQAASGPSHSGSGHQRGPGPSGSSRGSSLQAIAEPVTTPRGFDRAQQSSESATAEWQVDESETHDTQRLQDAPSLGVSPPGVDSQSNADDSVIADPDIVLSMTNGGFGLGDPPERPVRNRDRAGSQTSQVLSQDSLTNVTYSGMPANTNRLTLPKSEFDSASTYSSQTLLLPKRSQSALNSGRTRSKVWPSPLPEPMPSFTARRPFHLMRLLRNSITSASGGFLSCGLHIPRSIWTQAGVKLPNLDVKIRVIEILISNIVGISSTGDRVLEMRDHRYDQNMVDVVARDHCRDLDELDGVLDEAQRILEKKLGMTTLSVKVKKSNPGAMSGLGSKLTKTFDKMTIGKVVDSPTVYVDSLARLCDECQKLDTHLNLITSQAQAPPYDRIDLHLRRHIEGRLSRASDFFGSLVLPFILQDVNLLMVGLGDLSEQWRTLV